ncbi:MAG TPA: VOC family protein [Candidatus Dormibacteraeota bacterium]|nr:VOC family protein [Candidatus Dormibacteraeota bacterium]
MKALISGVHTLIYSHDADADRAFFRDVLGLDSVDSGGGWLIFALPPAELAIHPTEGEDDHELYLLCDDIEAAAKELERRKVLITRPFDEERWGRVTRITLPGGGRIGLYQPKHRLAHAKTGAAQSRT